MRKLAAIVVIYATTLSLVACGERKNPANDPVLNYNESEATTLPGSSPARVTDTVLVPPIDPAMDTNIQMSDAKP
jgi:hypothetical protein